MWRGIDSQEASMVGLWANFLATADRGASCFRENTLNAGAISPVRAAARIWPDR